MDSRMLPQAGTIATFQSRVFPRSRYVLAMALLPILPATGLAAETANEGQVKAAFVFNAMRYVEWPEGTPASGAPFTVCRTGSKTPFNQALSALEGRAMRGGEVRVRTVDSDPSGCQVLVLPEGEDNALLRRAQSRPILTVGEGWTFLEESAILAVAVMDGKLVFGANLDAARHANLHLSAQLLRLARQVVDSGRK